MRRTGWIKDGCNAFEKKRPTSQPLSFWTEQDILHYIKEKNLKIAEIYGDVVGVDKDGFRYNSTIFSDGLLETTGANRTGCTFCMFGIAQDTDRFLKLKAEEPDKYDYIMRGGEFDSEGMWVPTKNKLDIVDGKMTVIEKGGLGYKFVIDWLNEHGNLGIKY